MRPYRRPMQQGDIMCIITSHNIRAAVLSVILVMAFSFGVPSVVFAAPANTITITNKSGSAQINYPLQFGRPFIQGKIPNYPQVKIGGTPVPTQADVKNRYPDGSVEYAVIALIVPTLPATGGVVLTFADQAAGNNTPLTASQMLDPSFDFDATMKLAFPAMLSGTMFGYWTSKANDLYDGSINHNGLWQTAMG